MALAVPGASSNAASIRSATAASASSTHSPAVPHSRQRRCSPAFEQGLGLQGSSKGSKSSSSRLSIRASAAGGRPDLDELLSSLKTSLSTVPRPSTTSLVSSLPSLPALALDTSSAQARAFQVLSGTSGLLAVLALLVPDQLLDLALPASDTLVAYAGLDPTLLRVAGASLIISAAAEYCLQDAAANNRLTSATYQRLMCACVFKSTGYLLAFAAAAPLWNPLLVCTYPVAAVASVAVNTRILLVTNNRGGQQTLPSLGTGLVPQNPTAAVFSAFVLLYLLTAAACLTPADGPSLFIGEVGGASTQLLKHTAGPGFLLAAVACLNLKDAAERGRLGAGTFKRLNLGLALLELTYSAVFAGALATHTAEGGVQGASNLAASLGIASFCLYHWLYATKDSK